MTDKRVLIVDDEEAVLTILAGSLKKLGPELRVITANSGLAALRQIERQTFDLIITDYKMAGMNGLELLDQIHEIQPDARVILITAYGSSALESEARRRQAYDYLTKPLEINRFREIVTEALRDVAISRPGILILSDERYREINQLMETLKTDVGARCIFLTDTEGRLIARTGDFASTPIQQIASLIGGSVASLVEVGEIIDNDTETINLAYREGKQENMYVVNIGRQLLMILFVVRGPYSSRLGSVWYYAQQTAQALYRKLGEAEYASPTQMLGADSQVKLDDELDMLFGSDSDLTFDAIEPEIPAQAAPPVPVRSDRAPQPAPPPPAALPPRPVAEPAAAVKPSGPVSIPNQPPRPPAPPAAKPQPPAEPAPEDPANPTVLTYEQAVRAGLIPGDLARSDKPQ